MMKLSSVFMKLIPVKIIKKMKMAKVLASVLYNRKILKRSAIYCGDDVCIINPLSVKGEKYFSIGHNFKLDYFGIIEAWDEHNGHKFSPRINIGNDVSMGKNCHIGCTQKIEIGNNVLIGSGVLIIDHSHGMSDAEDILIPPNKRILQSKGAITIADNVWIGEKVCVLPGVSIGRNSIIGANSVVTKDIPANCVACGNPARVIKYISREETR